MKKKILLALLGIGILLFIFLTTEEKKDFLTEEIYWKKNIDSVQYNPPNKDWKSKSKDEFIKKSFILRLVDKGGLKKSPLYSITDNNNQLIYEAGYNAKNLFSELAVFRIKSVTDAKKNYLKEYMIYPGLSPSLEIRSGDKNTTIHLGEEIKDKSLFTASDESYLFTTASHTFRRFIGTPESFRERNLVYVGNGHIKKISQKAGKNFFEIENSPRENSAGGKENVWRRNTETRVVFDPKLGDDLDSLIKSFRYELFPDEDEDGILVIQELVKNPPEEEWLIETSEGRKIKILLFPKTLIGDKEYRPVIRTIDDAIQESPAYINHSSVERIYKLRENIREADQWQRPEKKIQ